MRISFRDLELVQCFIFSNKRASFSAVKLPPSPRAIKTILIFLEISYSEQLALW